MAAALAASPEAEAEGSVAVVSPGAAAAGKAGAVLPGPSRLGPLSEAGARPSLGTWVTARQVQESSILTAVRRQLEALEEKLGGHIAREVAKVQQQGDRLREAAIARVDAKLAGLEALQPKLERRLAELGGNCRGLSEEAQSQIRRLDQVDSRLWEWRHQLDEDVRAKLAEVEQSYQQICSSVRVSRAAGDDGLKRCASRVARLEELLEERVAQAEDLSQSLMSLHGRVLQLEEPGVARGAARELQCPEPPAELGDTAPLALIESQQVQLAQRLQEAQQESSELRSRLELQEERCKSLRTLAEARDEQFRCLGDRLERENWEGRLKELQARLHELERSSLGHAEQLEICLARLEGGPAAWVRGEPAAGAGRLAEVESRIGALAGELEAVRADLELAPRVAALVAALRDVAPKVIAQEAALGRLQQQLAELAARPGPGPPAAQGQGPPEAQAEPGAPATE